MSKQGSGSESSGSKYRETNDPDRIEALRSVRSTLEWLGDDVHYIQNEVDPHVEMCTITKAFDNSKALVANRIKGYPDVRMISNLYSTKERTAKIHGMADFKDCKLKVLDCIRNPIPPKVVDSKDAPCQQVYIPKEKVRHIEDLIPVAQHTFEDGGRIFGAGVHFFYGEPWVPEGGSQISMYRMSFREGQPYASINMVPGGGGDVICSRHPKGTRIPCTVNICPSVGAELVAVSTLNPVIFPYNTDKIGLAGAIQGSPVELVKAKTVDAYAMAQSEWVLEGYVVEGERVWETEEAERLGQQGVAPLHPEWARAMGHAYRTPRAFELTAITRRADNPIVYTPHFGAFWYEAPFMCAAVYEMCERMAPGFVVDVASWLGLTLWGGLVIQVKKQRRSDEGMQRNILSAVMGVFRGLRLVVIVDDDIDPWQPEDVVYAIESRASPGRDYVVFNEYSRGQAFQPSEHKLGQISVSDGGMGIDATKPLGETLFERAHYPVEKMDFSRWFSEQEIRDLKAMQDPYFRWLGEKGYG
ncbi:MAG: UbiD family decarboxylase [Hyphomicrobiaceae bacterium]